MRLHVVGLPHTETTAKYATCAYTQKWRKGAKMLTELGHEVILYWGEDNDAPCAEHVTLIRKRVRRKWFGKGNENDLERGGFDWDENSPWWREFNNQAVRAIRKRWQMGDLVLLTGGYAQKPIKDALPEMLHCEPGVGYRGIFTHAAFESEAWRHHCYGLNGIEDGRWYDTVIPNFFDPAEFPRIEANGGGDYLLYMGRLISRKGVHVAAQIAERAGQRLVVAGPGGLSHGQGWVDTQEGMIRGATLEYIGPVGIAERAELMAKAAAVLVPTVYIEPFGGVAIEANMAGTPVVTTPFGAFSETVVPGVNGYHFHTLQEGCDAVEKARKLDRDVVRHYANANYSLAAVGPRYNEWFDRLAGLWGPGWGA